MGVAKEAQNGGILSMIVFGTPFASVDEDSTNPVIPATLRIPFRT